MGTGRVGLLVDEDAGLFALLLCEGLLWALDELPCVGRLVAPEEDEGLLASLDEGLEEEGLDAAVLSDEFPGTGRLAWLPSG